MQIVTCSFIDFFYPSNRYLFVDDINKIVYEKLLSKQEYNELYNSAQGHMIHGPCGWTDTSSPCMKMEGVIVIIQKCSESSIIFVQHDYCIYKRRNNVNKFANKDITVLKIKVFHSMPFVKNCYAHINMKWCN